MTQISAKMWLLYSEVKQHKRRLSCCKTQCPINPALFGLWFNPCQALNTRWNPRRIIFGLVLLNSGDQQSSYHDNTYLMHLFTAKTSFLKFKISRLINVVSDNQDEMIQNWFDIFGRKFGEDAKGWDGKTTSKHVVKTRQDGTAVGAKFSIGMGR